MPSSAFQFVYLCWDTVASWYLLLFHPKTAHFSASFTRLALTSTGCAMNSAFLDLFRNSGQGACCRFQIQTVLMTVSAIDLPSKFLNAYFHQIVRIGRGGCMLRDGVDHFENKDSNKCDAKVTTGKRPSVPDSRKVSWM